MLEASQKKDLLQDAGGVLVAVILSVMVESGVHVTISMVDTGIACGVKHRQNVNTKKATQWDATSFSGLSGVSILLQCSVCKYFYQFPPLLKLQNM